MLLADDFRQIDRDLLSDPQTSGGLLVSCDADSADRALQIFRDHGFAEAAVIGEAAEGAGRLVLR